MNFIEKHTKVLAVALCLCASGPILSTVYAYETKPGWHGEDADRYYVLESNRERATGLTKIGKDVYYFNEDGEMQFGWQNVSEDTYYFDKDGTALTEEATIQGTKYNFQDNGNLIQGWSDDNKSYYDEQGYPVKKDWVNVDGMSYYFDKDGSVVSGWKKIDGKKYYFGENGQMMVGEFEVDGKKYCTREDGTFKTGWDKKSGKKVFYDKFGKQVKDSFKKIKGKTYAFDEDGAMLKGTKKKGYTIDNNGVVNVHSNKKVKQPKPETVEQERPQVVEHKKPKQPKPEVTEQERPIEQEKPAEVQRPTGDVNSIIVSAAMSQIGVNQDCTSLVSNALAAAGIHYHGWPEGYATLGSWTNNPVPGDIIIYSGHVAIYLGNGQAVHGGWLGNQTVVASVECQRALIGYIHI